MMCVTPLQKKIILNFLLAQMVCNNLQRTKDCCFWFPLIICLISEYLPLQKNLLIIFLLQEVCVLTTAHCMVMISGWMMLVLWFLPTRREQHIASLLINQIFRESPEVLVPLIISQKLFMEK